MRDNSKILARIVVEESIRYQWIDVAKKNILCLASRNARQVTKKSNAYCLLEFDEPVLLNYAFFETEISLFLKYIRT